MKLAVTYQMCGYIDVPGDTVEQSMENFNNDPDEYDLPKNAVYVDGSFELSTQDVDEMKAMTTTY